MKPVEAGSSKTTEQAAKEVAAGSEQYKAQKAQEAPVKFDSWHPDTSVTSTVSGMPASASTSASEQKPVPVVSPPKAGEIITNKGNADNAFGQPTYSLPAATSDSTPGTAGARDIGLS